MAVDNKCSCCIESKTCFKKLSNNGFLEFFIKSLNNAYLDGMNIATYSYNNNQKNKKSNNINNKGD